MYVYVSNSHSLATSTGITELLFLENIWNLEYELNLFLEHYTTQIFLRFEEHVVIFISSFIFIMILFMLATFYGRHHKSKA